MPVCKSKGDAATHNEGDNAESAAGHEEEREWDLGESHEREHPIQARKPEGRPALTPEEKTTLALATEKWLKKGK